MTRTRPALLALAVLVLVAPAGAASPASPARPLTARAVLQRIEKDGAEKVLDQLTASDRTWSEVLRGIRTGQRDWLQAAVKLKPLTGATAAELTAAVAEALVPAPAAVLALLGKGYDADDVCSLNTLEDTLGESYSGAVRKVEARQRAVRGVAGPALAAPREECLGFLDELRAEVDRSREAWFPKP